MSTTTTVTLATQPDGSVTASWSGDSNPNLSDYLVTPGSGSPVRVPAGTLQLAGLHLGAGDVVAVVPELSPETGGSATYTPPPPTLKPRLAGLINRNGVVPPPAFLPAYGGWDVCGKEQGAVGFDELFDANGNWLPVNPLTQAVAAIDAANKSNRRTDLALNFRPELGIHTPSGMLALDGPPIQMTDPTTGKTGLVPRWWGPKFTAAARELWAILGEKVDGLAEVAKVVFGSGSTFYSELDIRQFSYTSNIPALLAAGYTEAEDIATRLAEIRWIGSCFPHTPLGQAFNAFQYLDAKGTFHISPPQTSAFVSAMVAALGKQASIENNSVRYPQVQYPALYGTDMPNAHTAGAGVAIQLAAVAQVGDEYQAATYAATVCKARSIETTGAAFTNLTPAQAGQLRQLCLANA